MSSPAFHELDTGEQDGADENGYRAVLPLQCAWADRYAVLAYWLGSGGLLWPRNPSSGARARSGFAIPFGAQNAQTLLDGGPGSIGEYEHAKVTINFAYDNNTPSNQGGDLISETLEPTAEFVTVDPAGLRWSSATGDALTKDEAPGKLCRGINYTFTRHFVTSIPAGCLTYFGSCNSAAISAFLLGLTFGAETLLYNPPQLQRKWDQTLSTSGWSITYRFSYKYPGWNYFWRGKTGAWTQIYKADGSGVYKNYTPMAWSY